jgi:NTE family protein
MRAATVATISQHARFREATDLLILPDTDLDLREWRRFDDAVEDGYRATMEVLERTEHSKSPLRATIRSAP